MAWNESFSVADGGGWAGDASFATTAPKEAQTLKMAERLPVPVTVADLHDSASAEEKYELGDYPFSTVLTMGIVKSVAELENTTNHVLGDPEDMSKEFEVLTYSGVSDTEVASLTFVEGVKVMVVGKLRSLSDRYGIMSYNIREVIDDKEYRAFKLEAKIAKLYFEKNVPSILRSGMGQSLAGCAAGPPADAATAAASGEVMNVFGTQPSRIYSTPGAAASRGHNLEGQRGKIMDLLQREKFNYEAIGLSEGDIKVAIGAVNMDSLRKDLQFLVNEGHIYNTTDDEHYALID
ncbi:Replication protein A [Trichostrongylus colubriformis]|uniref:Replication protein A n=1 Tax=Trichostrongylus colubriformis TaxID=6319 RepID=A0AAN8F8P3_TRICO